MYRAFFDREINNISGVFTILDTKTGDKLFNRLPARSGQAGYTMTSWQRGKSPVPFSNQIQGELMIHIAKPKQFEQWPIGGGIGEFWPISASLDNQDIITSKDGKYTRQNIGLHPENIYKGSAGCIVLLHDTEAQKKELIRLHHFLVSQIGLLQAISLTVL